MTPTSVHLHHTSCINDIVASTSIVLFNTVKHHHHLSTNINTCTGDPITHVKQQWSTATAATIHASQCILMSWLVHVLLQYNTLVSSQSSAMLAMDDESLHYLLVVEIFLLRCNTGYFGLVSMKAVHGAKFAKSAPSRPKLNADHHTKTIQSKATNREFWTISAQAPSKEIVLQVPISLMCVCSI